MMSLRTFARAAPRATARLATYTTRTPFRSGLKIVSTPLSLQIPRATFSTSRTYLDGSSQELAAKLTSELQLEQESSDGGETASDSNVSDFLAKTDWQLHDVEGEQVIKLTRTYEGEKIEVRFSIADFNTPYPEEDADEALMDEEDEMDGQSGGANTKGAINQGRTSGGNFKVAPEDSIAPADREEFRDEEDNQPAFPAQVNVLISRPGKTGALRVHLTADSGEFVVNSIAHLPSADSPEAQSAEPPLSSESRYSGPPFQQLDEELQAHLENYLGERGIDTGLAMFVPEYIDVKEQKEYLAWLKNVKDFVE